MKKQNHEIYEKINWSYKYDDDDLPIGASDLGDQCSNEYRYKRHYNASKIIFLINDKSIKNYNSEMDDKIANCELFADIKAKFDDNISMNVININDPTSYK